MLIGPLGLFLILFFCSKLFRKFLAVMILLLSIVITYGSLH
jgi:hypothetical protein